MTPGRSTIVDADREWERLRERALTDPFLHRALHLERQVGRERALTWLALALSEERERLTTVIQDMLARAIDRHLAEQLRRAITRQTTNPLV